MNIRSLAPVLAVLVLLTGPSSRPSAQVAPTGDTRLLVILVVDQMRYEYLDRFKRFWKEGFARLLKDGAVFERAAYPYLNTVTCAGHATIATGAFPSTHGVIMNEWWQRAEHARMSCTSDPNVASVPYGGAAERVSHSALRLRVPTLGDRLRATSSQSRVVTLSMKPRSTVMLAGHGGTAVTWFADTNTWATSAAYSARPVPDVQAQVAAHPVDAYRGEIWNRVYGVDRYTGVDKGMGERPPTGWTPVFPHPLAGAPGTRPQQFYELWERSPFSDVALGEMAAGLVRSMKLGQHDGVDYLGVSFSALDYVGHNFGPNSHELQDTLVRLDHTLGKLLSSLDESVGADHYVLALSADHGVGTIPEALIAEGQDAGRVLNSDVQKAAEAAMVATHGPGKYVALVEYTELYLTDDTRKMAEKNPAALRPLIDAVARIPGVLRVMPTRGLEHMKSSSDPVVRAAALGYYPGVSGDLQIVLKPNWIGTDSSAATHGTFQPYDRQVPVIFLGRPFKPGRYADDATPADIAPTLGTVIKLELPDADGKALKRALK